MKIRMPNIAWLLFATSLAAAPHRYRDYPNASITITSIAEDPRGFFWLAASDGLYRFDGLHYQKFPGAPFDFVRYAGVTRDGTLWIAGKNALARYREGRFDIVAQGEITAFAVSGDLVFFGIGGRMHRVKEDGKIKLMPQTARGDLLVVNGALWIIDDTWAVGVPPDALDVPVSDRFSRKIFDYYTQAAPDREGIWWCADSREAVSCTGESERRLNRHTNPTLWRTGPLMAGRDGQLWFLGETIHGISPPVEFLPAPGDRQFLPTAGFEDKKGHVWVALRGKGLREWIPDSQWERWHAEDFDFEPVSHVFRSTVGEWSASTHGDLFRLDATTRRWTALQSGARHYYHAAELSDRSIVASVRRQGLVRLTADGKLIESFEHPRGSPDRFRMIVARTSGDAMVGGRLGLFHFEKVGSRYRLRTLDLPESGRDVRAVDLYGDPEHRMWVGYSGGIGYFDVELKWHPLSTDRPLEYVNSFAVTGDAIWVSYRGAGFFSRLQLRGMTWQVTDFLARDGYGPADTSFLRTPDRAGWVWGGTSDGVYVSDGRQTAPADWLHLNQRNGLPVVNTEAYGFASGIPDIWITGVEGVTRFVPHPLWFAAPKDAPAPWISRMEVDGREFFGPDAVPTAMPAETKSLLLEIGSFDSPAFRQHPFRYRLTSAQSEWKLSRDGVIHLQALAAGSHRLEVAYTGEGPSKVLVYEFQILLSSRWWLWSTGITLFAGLMALARRVPPFEGFWYALSKMLFVGWRRLRPVPPAPAVIDLSGQVVGARFHVSHRLSSGGFSTVYEGRDAESNERVAIKVLNSPPGKRSWVRKQFAFEVAALQSIRHPGVVSILDWWASPTGAPTIAMPFLDGPTLRTVLQDGPLAPERAARILRQLGSALAAVHQRALVHRDLKPENVILTTGDDGQERAVIVDFGTAGLRGPTGEQTVTALFAGSPEYMAPERMTGHYSPSTDAYSLGVMALELITSRRLSSFESHSPGLEFFAELSSALERPMGTVKGRQLASVLLSALDPDPKRRPTALVDWSELVAELMER